MTGQRLTSAQHDAIHHVRGNLQLIACAGLGKTEVVAQRVVSLLKPTTAGGGSYTPSNIVALTFTEKAAAELRERIHTRCREQLGTITESRALPASTELSSACSSPVSGSPR